MTPTTMTTTDKLVQGVSRFLILAIIAGLLVFAGSGVLSFLLVPVLTYTGWTGFWIGRMLIIRNKAKKSETKKELVA